MARYIDKDAVIAEIERKINEINLDSIEDWRYRLQREHDIEVMKNILSLIDTLEVKELDLDKEIEEHVIGMPMSEFTHDSEVEGFWDWARKEFRHFYELGLKAQKGE